MWQNMGGTFNNKQFRQKTEKEELRDINSTLRSMSGYSIAERSESRNNFEKVQKLLKEQQNYLYSIQYKTEKYFYITVIFFLISFGQQQTGEIPSFISVFSDQNIFNLNYDLEDKPI